MTCIKIDHIKNYQIKNIIDPNVITACCDSYFAPGRVEKRINCTRTIWRIGMLFFYMFIFYTFVFIHSFFIILFFIRSFFIPYFVYIYFLNVHFLYFYFLYSSFFMLFIFYKSKLLLQPSIKKIIFIHKIWPITQHMRLIT